MLGVETVKIYKKYKEENKIHLWFYQQLYCVI